MLRLPILFIFALLISNGLSYRPHRRGPLQNRHRYEVASRRSTSDGLAEELRAAIKGQVFAKGTPLFDAFRQVTQGVCNKIIPAVVTRPEIIEDISAIIRIARRRNMEISMRSGGHSYQCLGLKPDSIHVDLRSFNTIKRVENEWSILGTGNTWGDVRRVLPSEEFTYVHGQCLDVGVGGYLMGLGVHTPGLSVIYGSGADNVAEYRVVLADGAIAHVTADNTTILVPGDETERQAVASPRVIEHNEDNDLRFALRIAGNSYAIATEFKYRTLPRPEPLPVLFFVFIEDENDFKNIQRLASTEQYVVYLIQYMMFRQPKISNIVSRIWRVFGPQRLTPCFFFYRSLAALSSTLRKSSAL